MEKQSEEMAEQALQDEKAKALESFSNYQVVRIVDPILGHSELKGRSGTVVRLRRSDDCAWVAMHEPLPEKLRVFDVHDSRADHILLDPAECIAV